MSKQFENLFDDISENLDLNIDDLNSEEIGEEGGIPLGSIFSNMFGGNKQSEENNSNKKSPNSNKKIKTERNQQHGILVQSLTRSNFKHFSWHTTSVIRTLYKLNPVIINISQHLLGTYNVKTTVLE